MELTLLLPQKLNLFFVHSLYHKIFLKYFHSEDCQDDFIKEYSRF